MTALGQHSMVPPFYANRAKVAPRARTANTAREAPSMGIQLSNRHWENLRTACAPCL